MKKLFLTLIFLSIALSSVSAEGRYKHPMFIVGVSGDLPLMVTNGPSFSFFGEIRFKFGLGIILDFNFSKSYFYYKDNGWYGPANWDEVNNMGSSMDNWSFYQWNCQAALLAAWYIPLPLERFVPFIAAGPTFLWLMPADAAENYPEFNEYFSTKRAELSYIPGLQFRLGGEFLVIKNFLFASAGLKFKMNDLKAMQGTVEVNGFGNYFVNNTEIYITVALGF